MTRVLRQMNSSLSRKQFLRGGAVGLLTLMSGIRIAFGEGKVIKVGFILPDFDQLRWKNGDQAGFEAEAKNLGISVVTVASQNSETIQSSQVEDMLTQGVDVLMLTPVNGAASAALVRKANAAKVPVIAYNFMALNSDIAGFVGLDAIQLAQTMAEAAVKDKPNGNYVLCLGDEGTSVAKDIEKGFLNALKSSVDSGAIKIVSRQYNKGWSTDLARAQVENALTKTKNTVAAVICGNDGMAYGAIQALQAQQLGGKVFVCGADAEPRAQQLILQGVLTLSAFPVFIEGGKAAARASYDLAQGKKLETDATRNNGLKDVPWIKIPQIMVTKANLAKCVEDYPWWFDKSKLNL